MRPATQPALHRHTISFASTALQLAAAKNLALGLASTAFLVQPARAAEADAVDATVSALTDVVKVSSAAAAPFHYINEPEGDEVVSRLLD